VNSCIFFCTNKNRTCLECGEIVNIENVESRNEKVFRIYMNYFFDYYGKLGSTKYEQILRESALQTQILSGISGPHEECKNPQPIRQNMQKTLCCLQLPHTFVISFEWTMLSNSTLKDRIKDFMKCILPIIDLSSIYSIEDKKQNCDYVLRGLVGYTGTHYVAYFYSMQQDKWLLYDDAKVKNIGNFGDVSKSMIKNKQCPVLVFYESIGFIKMWLEEKKELKEKAYYETMKENNFWKGAGGSNCVTF